MKEKKNDQNNIISARWYVVFGLLIVIASVMAAGLALVGVELYQNQEDSLFIAMVGMILPMSLVMYLGIYAVIRHINKKISPLINGMHEVADGNLDVKLDETYGGEYAVLYRDFNKMSTELKATKESMDGFVNEFAHEFKTPITSISGFADYLLEMGDEIDAEERDSYLKVIADQSRRLLNLSQNTLLLSKVEAIQILTDREEYSLSDQLRRCVILFVNQIDERKITLNISEDTNYLYFGNQELMEQVWINLINNAVKFTPDGGAISISEERVGDALRIAISDTGIGMSQNDIDHIFDKYYQNDTRNMAKGNGIGLSIVKRIVELSGGTIEVESTKGSGSSFTVILPDPQ